MSIVIFYREILDSTWAETPFGHSDSRVNVKIFDDFGPRGEFTRLLRQRRVNEFTLSPWMHARFAQIAAR
jgi:hypothetical protein